VVLLLFGELLFGLGCGERFCRFFDELAALGDGAAVVSHGAGGFSKREVTCEVEHAAAQRRWRVTRASELRPEVDENGRYVLAASSSVHFEHPTSASSADG
jgi:hypothetical protein